MHRLSDLALKGIPFLFYTDFEGKNTHVYTLDELASEDIEFSLEAGNPLSHKHSFISHPMKFAQYRKGFDQVIEKIKAGETYLLNYTCSTPISTELSFKQIFQQANAPFKLRVRNEFVCFSPERFIKIENAHIYTYPMKGTIDASIDNAQAKILANAKEMAEHIMVVDLLRNDLSMVSTDVTVNRFRYIDKIKAGEKELLQVSSEIQGRLNTDWKTQLSNILQTLLPAGSISGTPKKRTVEIIKDVEDHQRSYFTGVFGVFDGEVFDSAVMIRFIEKTPQGLIYKSGGGITLDSSAEAEYQEMIDKIYLP